MTREEIFFAERHMVLLGRVGFDPELDGPTVHTIFTAPPGHQAIVEKVIFHSNTASLAGMTDLNIGGGPAGIAPVWIDNKSIASMTTVNSFLVEWAGNVQPIDGDAATQANRDFVIEVVSGATASGWLVLDAFGYLIES